MKSWPWGMVLAIGLATAACSAAPVAPASLVATETVAIPPPSAPLATSTTPPANTTPPTSTSSATPSTHAPATSKKAPTRKIPARQPPQYGYQCREGDELKYKVCAGHKAWIDGQLEFTNCLSNGGTWDIGRQRCVHP